METYKERVTNEMTSIHQTAVANKILQYMVKVRNEFDISQARRWVMELLQNARDLAYEEGVDVRITLEENQLVFEHNARIFGIKDILSLMHQVSSKKPGEGIGQFGTGFLSTYQLSEVICLESVLHEEGLPYRPFCVKLDRTGQTKEEILSAIAGNLRELEAVDESDCISAAAFCPKNFNTRFTYRLNTQQSREIAQIGIEDLADTIVYVLLFSQKLSTVELRYNLPDKRESILYRRGHRTCLDGGLFRQTIFEGEKEHLLIGMETFIGEEKLLTLASEYGEQGFLEFSDKVPKVFIDFPLLGGEAFPFPVVLNCEGLRPNEPRSSISLSDNSNSVDSLNNRQILDRAVKLFDEYLSELIEQGYRKGIDRILRVPGQKENKEWSTTWVQKHLYHNLYSIIKNKKLLPVNDTYASLSQSNMILLRGETIEERENVRQLLSGMKGYITPDSETDWYSALEGYDLTKDTYLELKDFYEKTDWFLKERLDTEKVSVENWSLMLYRIGMRSQDIAIGIVASQYAVFANQSQEDLEAKKLYTMNQLFWDESIPETLKDISEELDGFGTCNFEEPLWIRKKLFSKVYEEYRDIHMAGYEITRFVDYLSRRSDRNYRVSNFNAYQTSYMNRWNSVWRKMIACGPDEKLYELAKGYWGEQVPKREPIKDSRFRESMWKSTYCSVLRFIKDELEHRGSFETVRTALCMEDKEAKVWLTLFYQSIPAYINSYDFQTWRILPNQKGQLCSANLLYLDKLDPELKEIAEFMSDFDTSCGLLHLLVDQEITLGNWSIAEKKDREVALSINRAIEQLLLTKSLSEAAERQQEACTKLLGWLEEHREHAYEYFPGFAKEEDQMKLLTPKVAVKLSRKAKEWDTLLKEAGISPEDGMDELLRCLKRGREAEDSADTDKTFFDCENDVGYADGDFLGFGDEEREALLRKIGESGEVYGMCYLRDELCKDGYEILSETSQIIRLQKEQNTAELYRPDTSQYHQAGWDIRLTYTTETGSRVTYYEVKTNTLTSVRRPFLNLSNEQMIMAAKCGEDYVVLKMSYDMNTSSVVGCTLYPNLIDLLAKRRLVHHENGYLLRIMKE